MCSVILKQPIISTVQRIHVETQRFNCRTQPLITYIYFSGKAKFTLAWQQVSSALASKLLFMVKLV